MDASIRELKDGQYTQGSVSRVGRHGAIVRRPAGPWTPAVHGLLRYLESVRFPGSPRVVESEACGEEVVTYLSGEVAKRPWPECLIADPGISSLGSFLREYHRAVQGYVPPANVMWRIPGVAWRPGHIVRHGDLGPWNTVWNRGTLIGLIDWDFAEPGSPIEDVAQLAWYSVPLHPPGRCEESGIEPGSSQRSRFRLLCQVYGARTIDVLNTVFALQETEIARTVQFGHEGMFPWNRFLERGDAERINEDMRWLRSDVGNFR